MGRIAPVETVVITGGTGGLGSALAEQFRSTGREVVALGSGDLDLSDDEVVRTFFAATACDLLICCAGLIRDNPLKRMEESEWDHVWEVNFRAAERCARAAIPAMTGAGRGHVVFISSYAAQHPSIGQAAYATAKAALEGLTKDLAAISGPHGVRVNAIAPGFLETRMTEAVSEKRKAVVKGIHALGRFNTPVVAATFIRFLHEHLPHTSGQLFALDSRP